MLSSFQAELVITETMKLPQIDTNKQNENTAHKTQSTKTHIFLFTYFKSAMNRLINVYYAQISG